MVSGGLFPWEYSGRGVKLTTHRHLVPRSEFIIAIVIVMISIVSKHGSSHLLSFSHRMISTLFKRKAAFSSFCKFLIKWERNSALGLMILDIRLRV
jgi:hypothetical protein